MGADRGLLPGRRGLLRGAAPGPLWGKRGVLIFPSYRSIGRAHQQLIESKVDNGTHFMNGTYDRTSANVFIGWGQRELCHLNGRELDVRFVLVVVGGRCV